MRATDLFKAVERAIARRGNIQLAIRDPNDAEKIVLITTFTIVGVDLDSLQITPGDDPNDRVLLIE